MAGETYFELLQDPRWQKKRLEILEANDYTCEDCGSNRKTLHIHHTYYEKGLKPWEYPDESLHVLCKDCHKKHEEIALEIKRSFGRIGLNGIEMVRGFILGLESTGAGSDSTMPIGSLNQFEGFLAGIEAWPLWPFSESDAAQCLDEKGNPVPKEVRILRKVANGLRQEMREARQEAASNA